MRLELRIGLLRFYLCFEIKFIALLMLEHTRNGCVLFAVILIKHFGKISNCIMWVSYGRNWKLAAIKWNEGILWYDCSSTHECSSKQPVHTPNSPLSSKILISHAAPSSSKILPAINFRLFGGAVYGSAMKGHKKSLLRTL